MLRGMWDVPDAAWPSTVDFGSLQFQRRLHDTIDVVSIDGHGNQEFVFKSLMNDIKYLYHELKTLMAMKPHPNVIPSPIYLVTKSCGFGGRRGLDNIVMADSHDSDVLKVVIIDFEQRLGSPAWTPPEIHSVTLLADLIHLDPHSSISRSYQDLFCRHGAIIPESEKAASLNPEECEDAQVFMLGKLLWCLFENASLLNSYIGKAPWLKCKGTKAPAVAILATNHGNQHSIVVLVPNHLKNSTARAWITSRFFNNLSDLSDGLISANELGVDNRAFATTT
ncbi:kinase-like domain-containing protein [Fusarium coicis]|nr:kinase-like domain-containing protein [Fusarium coicis]